MTRVARRSARGFSLREMFIYVTLMAFNIAGLRIVALVSGSAGPTVGLFLALVFLVGLGCLGALLGFAVATLVWGRDHANVGAVFGGFALPAFLCVVLAIVLAIQEIDRQTRREPAFDEPMVAETQNPSAILQVSRDLRARRVS